MFNSIEEIKRANREAGQHFFDPETMRFFNSRVYADLYVRKDEEQDEEQGEDVTYFITSERNGDESPRTYTVRAAHDNGTVSTASDFSEYATLNAARKAARMYAGEDLAKYRWIMYMHQPMNLGFDVVRVETLRDAERHLREYTEATGFGYYFSSNEDGSYGCNASLYPYSAENWADAEEYREIGNPFDYPSKLIEFGPRGGARITNA